MSALSHNRRLLLALRRPSQFRSHASEAALGLRSHLPPDTGPPDPKTTREISDEEWEIRTGRAIYLIQNTLPEFFTTGLVYLPVANANPLDYLSGVDQDVDTIYSENIRLSYTPPVELPAPFPKTLNVEGAPLYFTSSVFVRHTLNALYSDLKVVLNKVSVNTHGESDLQMLKPRRKSRDKSLFVGLGVSGIARVSGAPGDWEVNSTYTFSPLTGLIHLHTVNSIHPAPHQTVYHALRASLGNVFGGTEEPSRPGGAAGAVSKTGDSRGS
ncbi:hypothetical protein FB45DRAFT_928392 [Roridomyces roridus]|uniref:Uncharacterized protein n=1 Tax=Roridomyces roridus TaxID=1738132 RepID=A0AAD7FFG0_9AGAR|nr:hypothetical protein FB45DRAFT_928392 [Roridomyces roridus]